MKVMIVDDYYDFASTLKDCFDYNGHTAEFYLFSTTAVQEALEFKPNWLVLDVRMPYISGVSVYKELKEIADFPFSVVFYSNYFDSQEVREEFINLKIPDEAMIPKTTNMEEDVVNKLIPALEKGYLKGGRRDEI
jgi:DNA-binding response OmpR family regulator